MKKIKNKSLIKRIRFQRVFVLTLRNIDRLRSLDLISYFTLLKERSIIKKAKKKKKGIREKLAEKSFHLMPRRRNAL
jgi:hypothetical protein